MPADGTVVYAGNKEVGAFMKKRVLEPGRTMTWNELTGQVPNPRVFVADFQGK